MKNVNVEIHFKIYIIGGELFIRKLLGVSDI